MFKQKRSLITTAEKSKAGCKQRAVPFKKRIVSAGPSFLCILSVFGFFAMIMIHQFSMLPVENDVVSKHLEESRDSSDGGRTTIAPLKASSTTKRPKLKTLVKRNKVIGDPQFLLDFAILGVAKCGTTTMRDWLCDHPEAHCPFKEVNDLSLGRPARLVKRLYELPKGNFKRGYKSPKEFAFEDPLSQANATKYLTQYWPDTRVMIGLRHPVLWFQSIYNFRLHQRVGESYMPHPNELIDKCHRHVCTERASFHVALARLGKTNMTAPEELEMIRENQELFDQVPPPRLPNKIFVWITDQLTDKNETRASQFRRDVQDFVGLQQEIPPVPHVMPPPGGKIDKKKQRKIDKTLIDICEPQYDKVRAELMEASRPASVWIRKYFLNSKDVVVSSREHFEEILMTWMKDPCEDRK